MNYIPSSCGLFGIMRKKDSAKISGSIPVKCLDYIRYRGSDKGSGYASFNLNSTNSFTVKIFYNDEEEKLRTLLHEHGIGINSSYRENGKFIKSCCYDIAFEDSRSLDEVNAKLWDDGSGRLYSAGKSLLVYKGVGYPDAVGEEYDLSEKEADMWLAHTRQPTNSPGYLPYWSHPFSTFNIAIVHNGDISSFGANREYLKSKGVTSFVGTDSEVIAHIFKELIGEYDLITALKIMSGNINDPEIAYKTRGCVLDGPYTLIIGYDDGQDIYMIAMADRTKLRPAILGEDSNNIFIASEESQIRIISPKAKIWTLEPGSFFISSVKNGIIRYGRENFENKEMVYNIDEHGIDAVNIEYNKLDSEIIKSRDDSVYINNVAGHRYIGITFPEKRRNVTLYGNAGNCLMNLNENNSVTVRGNVADDCCDSMSGGILKIFGDSGDVLGQALSGGQIYIDGNVGNRSCIQMREYGSSIPIVVVNGKFDDYLGEYMAGGIILVLSNSRRNFGKYIGSGMLGGRIFIRGRVKSQNIGVQPSNPIKAGMLKSLKIAGIIEKSQYIKMMRKNFIDIIRELPEDAQVYARKYYSGHQIPDYEYRNLSSDEKHNLKSIIYNFDREMGKNSSKYLNDKFTVIYPRKM